MFHGGGASVSVETVEPIAAAEARSALQGAPSILLGDESEPPPSTLDAVGGDAVQVAAVEAEAADPRWIHFWAAADNVRQGAALTAVAVAEAWLRARPLDS
jgi:aspartate-semialdehyde dehydrogenase